MGMWEILEEGRDDYGRGFGMRGDEAVSYTHLHYDGRYIEIQYRRWS